jgi:hypothetical protein
MVTGMSGKLKVAHIWPWAQSKHPSLVKLKIPDTAAVQPGPMTIAKQATLA